MDTEQLIVTYPRLYHMAEPESWPGIARHGLLSTAALLDLFEITVAPRDKIESQHRPELITIEHERHGRAVIRDQKPMSDSALAQCLDGMSLREWYRLLNGKVFFWVTRDRLLTLLGAKAYRSRPHCVITTDTRRVVERHHDRITLSPINSGSTIYNPPTRGRMTFRSIRDYPFECRRKKRGSAEAVVELAVEYSVPDISDLAFRVEQMVGSEVSRVLFSA